MTPLMCYSLFVIAIAVITQFALFSYKSITIVRKRDNETVRTFLVESLVSTFTPSSANILGFLEVGYPEDACTPLLNDHSERATVLLATTSGCSITKKILTAGKMGYSALLLYAEDADDENASSNDKIIADAHIRKGVDNVEYVARVTKEDALILKNSYSYPSSVRFYISTENNCHFYNCRFFIPLGRLSFLEIAVQLLVYSLILVFMYSAISEIIKAVVDVAIMYYRKRKQKATETFARPLVDDAQLENELEKKNDENELENGNDEDEIENNANVKDLCVICQDVMGEFDVQNLPCNHWFHVKCLEEWTINYKAKICPTCRCKVKMNDNLLFEIDTEPDEEDENSDLRQLIDELIQQRDALYLRAIEEGVEFDNN